MPESSSFATLPAGLSFLACMTCGAAVPPKGAAIHDDWHRNIADAAISTQKHVEQLQDAITGKTY